MNEENENKKRSVEKYESGRDGYQSYNNREMDGRREFNGYEAGRRRQRFTRNAGTEKVDVHYDSRNESGSSSSQRYSRFAQQGKDHDRYNRSYTSARSGYGVSSSFRKENRYGRNSDQYFGDPESMGNNRGATYRQSAGYRDVRYSPRPYAKSNGGNSSTRLNNRFRKKLEYKEENVDPNAPIRLNKYMANAGICSRRDADKYIIAGVVSVNGNIVTELGTKVLRTDEVRFHDQLVRMERKVYVLLNKPKDYVTTSEDPQNRKTVMDLVRNACSERIYPVGRLDRNTTGVLLLTNDGDLASKLTHPKFLKKKIYHVYTDKNVTANDMRLIAEGITLDDGEIHADAIDYASPTDKKQVGIEIHSGKNRIVRRIFESLGYRVVKLDRVYFAGLTKKNLRRGAWRYLTEKEVAMLRMGAFE